MIKFITSSKNSTIYKRFEMLNTGSDEIIEIRGGSDYNQGPDISRILIQFDTEELNNLVNVTDLVFLNLKITEVTELSDNLEIELYPIAEEWTSGTGRFIDSENNYPGASWKYRGDEIEWSEENTSEIESGGGTWLEEIQDKFGNRQSLKKTIKLKKYASDIKIDITDYYKLWTSYQIDNNGIIVKFKNDSKIHNSCVKFFSKNTNTIYEPYLEIAVNDFIFEPCILKEQINYLNSGSLNSGSLNSGSLNSGSLNSGSLNSGSIDYIEECPDSITEIHHPDILPRIKRIKSKYDRSSIIRLDVGVRELNPIKTFEKRMRYSLSNFTKIAIYYSLIDAETEEIVVGFSKFTRVSCDTKGHFINFDFGCCKLGRMYKFILKIGDVSTGDLHIDTRTFTVI